MVDSCCGVCSSREACIQAALLYDAGGITRGDFHLCQRHVVRALRGLICTQTFAGLDSKYACSIQGGLRHASVSGEKAYGHEWRLEDSSVTFLNGRILA